MLLAFDIGNTNLVAGVFDGEKLVYEGRLQTHPVQRGRDYLGELAEQTKAASYSGCIVSSVVPALTATIVEQVKQVLGLKSLVLDGSIETGLDLKVDAPAAVGADRIANAVAVRGLWGAPALAVDFGTATTIDLVDQGGAFQGGIIAPGIGISMEALVERTAKLPLIRLEWPKSVLGKDTIAAMQSGVVRGYVCLVEGLIEQVIKEVGPIQHIVATGGLGKLPAAHSTRIKHYDPQLTLKGLRLIASLNGVA